MDDQTLFTASPFIPYKASPSDYFTLPKVSNLSENKALNDSSLSDWLDQSDDHLTLVVFTADWAGSVAILKGFLEKIIKEMPSLVIHWVDVEANRDLSNTFGINQIPSIVMLRHHEVVDHVNGILPRKKLSMRIQPHL